jgi:hypothetical protein
MQEINTINSDKKKEFIHKEFSEIKDFKLAYNSMPKVLRLLALQGLFINSFLSIAGLANKNNLFLKGVNGINGASGFFVDVLNFSSGLEKIKKKLINSNSSISRILITMLLILFLLHPLMNLLLDLIQKKINKSEKYSYLFSSSVSIIQSISSILMVSFFTMSVGILIQRIIQKNYSKGEIIVSESDLQRREKKVHVLMLIFSIFILLTFSLIQLLILRELSNLEKIMNKDTSQKILFASLTYINYLISSVVTLLGIYLVAKSVSPMIKKIFEKISEDEEKKIKKRNVSPLSIIFYISTVGLFALSSHIANISGLLDKNNIGTAFGYDVLRKIVLISGILVNGFACYFIFKGVMSLDDLEKLLEEFFDKEDEQSLEKLEKIAVRNKAIGASLIIASALGTTGLLSTLIYAEVNNIDRISNFIKKPEFLSAISIVVATFVLVGISFYGKVAVVENLVQEYKNKNLEVNDRESVKVQKQIQLSNPIKIDSNERIEQIGDLDLNVSFQ